MVPPYADVGGAGALTLLALGSLAFKPDDTSTTSFVIAEVALLGIAAVFAYSAYTGQKSVKRCRALEALRATPVRE